MSVMMVVAGFLAVPAGGAADIAIDRILPSLNELGAAWNSNRVVLLVDPLSRPGEVSDSAQPEAALRSARDGMSKDSRSAQALVRYHRGKTGFVVFVSRFGSESAAEANWSKTVEEEEDRTLSLPSPIGERFRFSHRDGMHNDLTFQRGQYFITVECVTHHGWEDVIRLARAIDEKLLKEINR